MVKKKTVANQEDPMSKLMEANRIWIETFMEKIEALSTKVDALAAKTETAKTVQGPESWGYPKLVGHTLPSGKFPLRGKATTICSPLKARFVYSYLQEHLGAAPGSEAASHEIVQQTPVPCASR